MGILRDLGQSVPGHAATAMEICESEDLMVVHSRQDVEPLLERNVRFQNSGLDGYTPSRDWQQVASIPTILIEKWYKEEGLEWWNTAHTGRLLQKLDDPDLSKLRTGTGHLGKRPYRKFLRGSSSPQRPSEQARIHLVRS